MNRSAWWLEQDENKIVWLHLDCPDSAVNTLSHQVLEALDQQLVQIGELAPAGVVILSDKPRGFIAGADVSEFIALEREVDAERLMRRARTLFERIERLPMPTVAMIHGHCFGGGLELALSCRYRILEEDGVVGFPEINLGIFPGFGGTVRSIRRMGVVTAMGMMLSGRPQKARSARRSGVVDRVVPQRQLRHAAIQLIQQQPKQQHPAWWLRLLELQPLRGLAARWLKRETAKRVRPDHYPAPFALIDTWRRFGGDATEMFQREGEMVSRLLTGTVSQNLTRLFFLQKQMKSYGKQKGQKKISHIHIIGAGVMGSDIAAWCALKGLRVTLQDRHLASIAKAVARAHQLFRKKLHNRRKQQAAMDRLTPDLDGDGVSTADLVLEVIVEDLQIKRALFQQLEPEMRPDALLATNTSSIPIDRLSEGLSNPQRVVGIHFFNPVAKMKLVEVVSGTATDQQSAAQAAAFVVQIGRLPLPVRSAPGFLVNRILMPYLMEAVRMVEEGTPPEVVDKVALSFGMPMGPIVLADTVGLDICVAVGAELAAVTGDEMPQQLVQWVEQGRLGRKSGHGFYRYHKGKPQLSKKPWPSGLDLALIEDRMILRMVNEAVRCLREQVVENGDLLDSGMVFGTGFAPFRGGVMQYIGQQGATQIEARLDQLEAQFGPRFRKDEGWHQI